MQKVLIAGGSYFIGKAVADRLSRDYDVTLLNRGSKPAPDGMHQIVCDRNDVEGMRKALSGQCFDYVVDVCGLNSAQAEILAGALENPPEVLVFISSSAVYDAENLRIPFKENDRLACNKFWQEYGTDKIAAEEAYRRLFADTSAKTVFLRPPYVYGENNYAQRESFIFDHLINNRTIIIPKSNPMLQFIYAPDLAEIIAELLSKSQSLPQNSVYNVGNTEGVSCHEWVEACARAADLSADIAEYDHTADDRCVRDFFPFWDYDNVLEVSTIKTICPNETPFEAGLKNAFEWFKDNWENIVFKPDVAQNEIEILKKLKR